MTIEVKLGILTVFCAICTIRFIYLAVVTLKWMAMVSFYWEYAKTFYPENELPQLAKRILNFQPPKYRWANFLFWKPAEYYVDNTDHILWLNIVDHWYESRD